MSEIWTEDDFTVNYEKVAGVFVDGDIEKNCIVVIQNNRIEACFGIADQRFPNDLNNFDYDDDLMPALSREMGAASVYLKMTD